MAFCTKCGGRNEEGTKFCTNCGNPLSASQAGISVEKPLNDNLLICTKCGGKNEKGIKFCTNCGNPLSAAPRVSVEKPLNDNLLICTKCGGKNEKGTKFCTSCGNPLSASQASVSVEKSLNDNLLICTKCGGKNEKGIKFCTSCGNPLSASQSVSVEKSLNDNLLICTKCGGKNEKGIKFCTGCGSPLNASPSDKPVSDSTSEKPIIDKPVNTSPSSVSVEKPSDDKPVSDSTSDKPVKQSLLQKANNQLTEKPVNDNQLNEKPITEKPINNSLPSDKPVTNSPSTNKPVSDSPIEKPITDSPPNVKPVTETPVIDSTPNKSGKVIKKKKKVFLWLLVPLLVLGLICTADIFVNKNDALTFNVYSIVSKKIAETINLSKSETVEPDAMPIQQVTPVSPEPMTPLDASTYLLSLKLGVSIANSFDTFNGRNQDNSETGWGNPVIDQELLNGIAAAGFSIVRIPVTWTRFIGSAPDYKIIESRLSRIAEVVNMARNAGLKVIINIHHDGAVWDTTVGWLRVDIAAENQAEKERITARFQTVWRQIAEYFANYGDYLIFESFNELYEENWWDNPLVQAQVNIVNEWNELFVDTVRNTGGNNSKRFLILKGYAADGYQTAGKLVIPPDAGNSGSNKLIVAFRYYEPYAFTHDLTMTSWGTAADKARVDQLFDILKKEYIDKGIPVILSGFGVKLNFDILDVQRNYLGYIAGAAHKRGMPALYNDEGNSDFRIFDRNSGKVWIPMRSNVQAIMDAVK
ncbi:MAG: cellulase family glycosylhydrolase [Treponema sp.]|jgi:endoglucanase|nr:cellulase family glycosylhydrolase [Treponema sp.]